MEIKRRSSITKTTAEDDQLILLQILQERPNCRTENEILLILPIVSRVCGKDPLLQHLSTDSILRLCRCSLYAVTLSQNTMVCRNDQVADSCFVLASGSVSAWCSVDTRVSTTSQKQKIVQEKLPQFEVVSQTSEFRSIYKSRAPFPTILRVDPVSESLCTSQHHAQSMVINQDHKPLTLVSSSVLQRPESPSMEFGDRIAIIQRRAQDNVTRSQSAQIKILSADWNGETSKTSGLKNVSRQHCFGALSLLQRRLRYGFSVRAETKVVMLVISRPEFEIVLRPDLDHYNHQISSAIAKVPLFIQHLNESQIRHLVPRCQVHLCVSEHVQGEVDLHRETLSDGLFKSIVPLGRTSIIGTMLCSNPDYNPSLGNCALTLSDHVYSAGLSGCTLLSISCSDLRTLVEFNQELATALRTATSLMAADVEKTGKEYVRSESLRLYGKSVSVVPRASPILPVIPLIVDRADRNCMLVNTLVCAPLSSVATLQHSTLAPPLLLRPGRLPNHSDRLPDRYTHDPHHPERFKAAQLLRARMPTLTLSGSRLEISLLSLLKRDVQNRGQKSPLEPPHVSVVVPSRLLKLPSVSICGGQSPDLAGSQSPDSPFSTSSVPFEIEPGTSLLGNQRIGNLPSSPLRSQSPLILDPVSPHFTLKTSSSVAWLPTRHCHVTSTGSISPGNATTSALDTLTLFELSKSLSLPQLSRPTNLMHNGASSSMSNSTTLITPLHADPASVGAFRSQNDRYRSRCHSCDIASSVMLTPRRSALIRLTAQSMPVHLSVVPERTSGGFSPDLSVVRRPYSYFAVRH